MGSKAMG